MTSYLLAGGGTAGHVNPMLAIADEIRRREPQAHIIMIGTKEGLEATLVPQRGYELHTIARLPFPRRPNMRAVRFVTQWNKTVRDVMGVIRDRRVDVVIGVGGYAAAPAYAAARKLRIPLVVHEANAKPGMANALAARWTRFVGVAFAGTALPHARFVGMPLRSEIENLDVTSQRNRARAQFGLEVNKPVLVVTGGSLGATSINSALEDAVESILAAGVQVLHITGKQNFTPGTERPGYIVMPYCDNMADAFAAADLVVSRAGSSTVSELSALGVPAIYVPYAVGNGEQKMNARNAVAAGGALLVEDSAFNAHWILGSALPLITDSSRLAHMSEALKTVGERHGSSLTVDLVSEALTDSSGTSA